MCEKFKAGQILTLALRKGERYYSHLPPRLVKGAIPYKNVQNGDSKECVSLTEGPKRGVLLNNGVKWKNTL